jgi:tetratricopeptide (TPR) repeat protein
LKLKNRQYSIFIGWVALGALLVIFLYPTVNREWIDYRKAENLFFSRCYSQAIPFYRRALSTGLTQINARLHLGDALLATRNFVEAVDIFEQIVSRQPDSRHIIKLAALYEQLNRLDDAIALLRKNSTLLKSDLLAIERLADLYRNKKDYGSAKTLYLKALAIKPDAFIIRFKLAEILAWIGEYTESIRLYREILRSRPDHRLTRVRLARVLGWNGQFEEAIRVYRIVLGESP